MNAEDGVKWELAKFAWQVGSGLSLAERTALMLIMRTRTGATGDWLKEIEIARELHPRPYALLDIRDPWLRDLLQVVDSVYNGSRADNITCGATHWTLPGQMPWFSGLSICGVIGGLTLWK